MTLKYLLMVLYHKLRRDGYTVIDKGFTISVSAFDVCKYCSRTISEAGLRPMINSKKEISFACNECIKERMIN